MLVYILKKYSLKLHVEIKRSSMKSTSNSKITVQPTIEPATTDPLNVSQTQPNGNNKPKPPTPELPKPTPVCVHFFICVLLVCFPFELYVASVLNFTVELIFFK